MGISLYPHQQQAVDKLRSGSILCGGVGSGKSRTAIAYYFLKECGGSFDGDGTVLRMKNPKDLYIITTARKRDTFEWESECLPFLLSTHEESCWHKVKVVVDSWNNIKKYEDVSNAFFIFDEQRLVGYGAWVKAFRKIAKTNRWILLSATPGDTWSDYIPVFVANGFYKNKTEFLRRHAVFSRFTKYPKIERYVDCNRLEKLRAAITVDMPSPRHTTRHVTDISVTYDEKAYKRIVKDLWNPYSDEPIKDAGGRCYAERRCVNSDPSRIRALLDILKQHSKAIVFYNFDYELQLLRETFEASRICYSELNGHKHESIPKADSWVYLVQYTAGAEGWNCIQTDTIIFYSPNYSYKMMEQASGRIDRLNTPYFDLWYYRLRSNSPIDQAIFRAIASKKKFNEKKFVGELDSR